MLGRVTTQHDPRGITNTLSYSYDNLDRLTARAATNLGTLGAAYDALGRRTSLTDGTGTTSFGYDQLSRVRSVQAPNTGHLGYDYDARGLRTKLIYPDGSALQYGYAADGQLHIVTGTTTLASYSYDSAGRLQSVAQANGATTTNTYDGADRLRDLRMTVGGSDVSRFQYTVDRLGQRTNATETLSTTRTISYTYDGLQRLSGATEAPGTTYSYAYDNAGNRTGVWVNGTQTVTQTFNAANQVNGFTYDAAGNLTNDSTTTSTYDALNRMIGSGGTTYSYNGDGVLVYDGTTRYTQDLISPLSQILQTTQGSTTTTYLYGMDRLASVEGSSRTWYGSDALGSVRQTISDVGLPLSVVNYDPWGTVEGGSVPMFGFTGELQDVASGLVHLRARWYATEQGRFESRDQFVGSPDQPYSLHTYRYGYSNPALNTDPSGYCVTGETACWNNYNAVVAFLGFPAIDLDKWDTSHLVNALEWLEDGIRFTNNSPSLDDTWTANNLSTVFEALRRVQVALGSKTRSGLGLMTGTLTFNKNHAGSPTDGALGGLTDRGLVNLWLRQDTHKLSSSELPIEIAIHELGHIVDINAGFDDGSWWSTCADWQNAIKDKKGGAVSQYARDNLPREDFAETFTWFVENQNGRSYQYPYFGKNPSNAYDGAPDEARQTALQSALDRLP